MRGRKPELKAIEGGLARVPRAPAWLSPEAKQEWARVVPALIRRRVLTAEELGTVEAYCLAVGLIRRCQEAIAREGETITTDLGAARRHPMFTTLFQSMTEARRLAAELGLTPTSRNKVRGPEEGEGDAWDGMDI